MKGGEKGKDKTESSDIIKAEVELSEFVDKLMKNMQEKFDEMSGSVDKRLDTLGSKIDDIEKNITELINEIGNEDLEA
jgi:heat shock factor-binding protein 1